MWLLQALTLSYFFERKFHTRHELIANSFVGYAYKHFHLAAMECNYMIVATIVGTSLAETFSVLRF